MHQYERCMMTCRAVCVLFTLVHHTVSSERDHHTYISGHTRIDFHVLHTSYYAILYRVTPPCVTLHNQVACTLAILWMEDAHLVMYRKGRIHQL